MGDEIPASISHYIDTSISHNLTDYGLHQVSERLWSKCKELERKPAGEAEWMETLYAAINDLKQEVFEAVRNQGKLTFPRVLC